MAKEFNTTGNLAMANVSDYMVMLNGSVREVLRVVDRTVVRGRKGMTLVTVENARTGAQTMLTPADAATMQIRKALKTDVHALWNGAEPLRDAGVDAALEAMDL